MSINNKSTLIKLKNLTYHAEEPKISKRNKSLW